jgi:hypothetical protein
MRKSKPIKVIIDTNIWVSFLISNKIIKLDSLFYQNRIIVLFSKELLDELNKVSKYPKLKKYFSPTAIEDMINSLNDYLDFIEVFTKVNICRDPNDNFLLSLAKDGKANYLITGDNDLLDLKSFGQTKIISLVDFLAISKNIR